MGINRGWWSIQDLATESRNLLPPLHLTGHRDSAVSSELKGRPWVVEIGRPCSELRSGGRDFSV